VNRRRLLIRLLNGHLRNVAFDDLVNLVEGSASVSNDRAAATGFSATRLSTSS